MKDIVLVGGGGHCKSVIVAAESAGKHVLGILDKSTEFGKDVLPGYKVIGCDEDIYKYIDVAEFVNTIGFISNLPLRLRISDRITKARGWLATIIAATASVSKYSNIEEGTVVLHEVTINAGVKIGKNCIINTAANIEHDVTIGDQTHISTGVMINGDCKIGSRVFVGSGAVIANGIHVCDDVIIGCGSVIIRDITRPGTYVGNPAHNIK